MESGKKKRHPRVPFLWSSGSAHAQLASADQIAQLVERAMAIDTAWFPLLQGMLTCSRGGDWVRNWDQFRLLTISNILFLCTLS